MANKNDLVSQSVWWWRTYAWNMGVTKRQTLNNLPTFNCGYFNWLGLRRGSSKMMDEDASFSHQFFLKAKRIFLINLISLLRIFSNPRFQIHVLLTSFMIDNFRVIKNIQMLMPSRNIGFIFAYHFLHYSLISDTVLII